MKIFLATILFFAGALASNPEEGDLFEGDMELNPDQLSAFMEQMSKGNGFAAIKAGLWMTNGRRDEIQYYIDPQIYGAKANITAAIEDYTSYTCLKFKRTYRRPSGPHLFFTTGSGCSSPVGKMRNGNSIRLARGCWRKGTIMHEIGHSIGLFHEQSRPDRNTYVKIIYENIKSGKSSNFNRLTTSRIDSRGSPYDFYSMMHYGGRYFSKNKLYTIKTKNPKYQNIIGQRNGFSKHDKKQINLMYKCQL